MMALAPDPLDKRAPIVYVSYDFWAPAANPVTHKIIAGEIFRCHVPVSGKRFCVLFARADT
jgi:hypothetical protein